MAVFVKKEPWPAITKAVSSCRGKVYAASGYVSDGAYELLPLKSGDVLVCDASPQTVRSGATVPRALRPFLKEGVEVWSKAGLHAKVVVLPRRAFVGSANASNNSARRLFEATLETTNLAEVQELRSFVQELRLSPVTESVIRGLEALVPKRPKLGPAATDPARLPTTVDRLLVIDLATGDFTAQDERALENGKATAREKARASATDYSLTEFAFSTKELEDLADGDWVLCVVDSEPEPPAAVVHKETFGKRCVVWLATPKTARALSDVASLGLGRDLGIGEVRRVGRAKAQRLLDLHRLIEDVG